MSEQAPEWLWSFLERLGWASRAPKRVRKIYDWEPGRMYECPPGETLEFIPQLWSHRIRDNVTLN